VRARRRSGRAGPERGLDAARARAVAFDLLSRKPWTRRGLEARLRRRGAPAATAAAVVADLAARGYVDDRAFATAWAETRGRSQGLGRRRLREELLARGVARPLVDEALGQVLAEPDEEARARAWAARRAPLLHRLAPESAARRLTGYLLRRGFPAEVVRRVVRDACGVPLADE
jgi:regulatory protein